MRLLRRIVTVLAGGMLAAGTLLGVYAAVVPEAAPNSSDGTDFYGGVSTPDPYAFNVPRAEEAVSGDVAVLDAWTQAKLDEGKATLDERLTAALASQAVAPFATSTNATSELYAREVAPQTAFTIQGRSQQIIAAPADPAWADPPVAPSVSPEVTLNQAKVSTLVVFGYKNVDAADLVAVQATTRSLSTVYGGYLDTPREVTDLAVQNEPTDFVALKAAVDFDGDGAPEPVANWSLSATQEIQSRAASGALEQDTLNLSLVSAALRETDPATANALNAELRYRQASDGSVGGIRETAEAIRALALGGIADQRAAVRALNWLDTRGPLPADLAVHRLRAHAYDEVLAGLPPSAGGATAPPVPAASRAGFGIAGGLPKGVAGLSLMLLVGGIGLSLSLVTVDALKGQRRRLFDTIREHPGLHVNELRRRLLMSPSSIEYHLAVLLGAGLVVAEEDGRYKRYYANGAGLGLNPSSPNSRTALGALRRPHAQALVRALLDQPGGGTPRELSHFLGIHETAASRRLAHLEKTGLLASRREGRARVYQVREPAAAAKALAAVEKPPVQVSIAPLSPAPAAGEGTPAQSVPATH